ncbi:MAG: hypothetical protein ABSD67_19515 [Terracidiphilus sp.]|jgi:hypothetical protein
MAIVANMKLTKLCSPHFTTTRLTRVIALALAVGGAIQCGVAQDVPLISGGIGFFTRTSGGDTNYQPYIEPVIAAPLGSHLLVESRATVLDTFFPKSGAGYSRANLFKTVDYLQADVLAGPHLTVVAGEFLTPFGTYNERLTQIWIQNFQDIPLIYGVGTMNTGSGVGGMLRGSVVSTPDYSVSYAAYYSANVNSGYFGAERSSGGQGAVYLPKKGLEIGTSYGRSLAGIHENNVGVHLWWEPINSPFRFRSEYAHAPHADGYWFETGYPLSHFGGADSWLGRFEPLFRMQQTFRFRPDPNDGLPTLNTQEADFGLDYHLPHEVRINTSYARQFSASRDVNIWETGLIYRFLFPTWKGRSN